MKTILTALLCLFTILQLSSQTFPNLVETDIDGIEHNIQEDYLDNGIPVLVHFWAAWNFWDKFFLDTMSMQSVYSDYGPDGSGQIMMLAYEMDQSSTTEQLSNYPFQNGFVDWTQLINYPIINPDNPSWAIDTLGIFAMPSLALFCPDGSIYTLNTLDSTSVNWPINVTEEMNYGNFLTADGVTDAFENLCGTMIDDENVSGTVTLNLDICEENLELPLDNIVVTFSDGTNTQIRTTNKFGYYEAFLADGTYDISFSNPSNLMSICLEPVSVNVSGNVTTGLNAVYTADVYCPETTLSINPWLIRPCGIASFVSVEICNVGTADLDEYELFVNLPVNSTVISANTENSYNYDPATGVFSSFCDSVAIFECRTYQIGFYAPCETTPGDTVCFSMEINPLSLLPSCDYLQTTDSLCAVVVGSYDPNDKTGLTLGKGVENYIDAGTEIEYMIRFQNTGTDTAFVVRIEDMISPVFDPTTIRPISSSHEYEMTYGDDKLVFHFPNILLVDSFKNEPESHGFIVFKINLRENLEPGTEILNNAGIYFDGNEPVITNTYKYVVTIPTRLIETNFTSFSVYPNPTQNSINIDLSSLGLQSYDVTISNLQGQKILEQGSNDQIIKMDVQSLNTGLYFITVKDNEGRFVAVEKFIKE